MQHETIRINIIMKKRENNIGIQKNAKLSQVETRINFKISRTKASFRFIEYLRILRDMCQKSEMELNCKVIIARTSHNIHKLLYAYTTDYAQPV